MKKSYFLSVAVILYFSITSSAQIAKGSILLGGDLGFSTQKTTNSQNADFTQSGFTISPSYGKAIRENLFLGGFASYNYGKNENSFSPGLQKTNGWGLGMFIRKYHKLGNGAFSFFAQGSAGYAYYKNYNFYGPDNSTTEKRNSVYVNIYPGINYKINKRLQLETGFNNLVSLGYYHSINEMSGIGGVSKTISNGFNLNTSINNLSNLYAGFRVLISK